MLIKLIRWKKRYNKVKNEANEKLIVTLVAKTRQETKSWWPDRKLWANSRPIRGWDLIQNINFGRSRSNMLIGPVSHRLL